MIAKDSLILLDTNILVHVLRGKEAGHWLNTTYQLDSQESRPLVSAVSFGELLALAEKWRWAPKRREKIYELLRVFVVVGIKNELILENYAKLSTYWERAGKRLGKTIYGLPPLLLRPTRFLSRRTLISKNYQSPFKLIGSTRNI